MEKLFAIVENFGEYQGRKYDNYKFYTLSDTVNPNSKKIIFGGSVNEYKCSAAVFMTFDLAELSALAKSLSPVDLKFDKYGNLAYISKA